MLCENSLLKQNLINATRKAVLSGTLAVMSNSFNTNKRCNVNENKLDGNLMQHANANANFSKTLLAQQASAVKCRTLPRRSLPRLRGGISERSRD